MKQLSGLDATFLYLETAEMPMHVGALHLFELPAGYRGKFVRDLRRHIAQRLPLAPPLRRRLWWLPLNLANPAWVDAEPDLNEHIVEIRLPKGSTLEALNAEVARLHPVLLDRQKPLWKFHVFEGLPASASGRRQVALYTQLHHAAVDGQAAVALANAILDPEPDPPPRALKASTRPRTFRLSMTEALRGALAHQAGQVARIVRELPDTLGTLSGVAGTALKRVPQLAGGGGSSNVSLAPRTPLNVSVTASRAFATATLPLPELKTLARAHGATLNDLVLMLVSTALRRFYGRHRKLPRKSMIAAVPISLRAAGDTTMENQASMSLVSLGTHLADPAKRFAHVHAATGAMKSTMGSLKSVLPTDFPSLGVPWLMEAVTALYGRARVADRIPQLANVVISNVPGPPVPLYLAGARMLTNYPASIVVHGLALNITVQSYAGSLDFGLMADGAAMPDVARLAEDLHVAMDDLRGLPLPGEAEAPEGVTAAAAGLVRRAGRAGVEAAAQAAGEVSRRMVRGVVQGMTGAARATTPAVRKKAAAPAPKRRKAGATG